MDCFKPLMNHIWVMANEVKNALGFFTYDQPVCARDVDRMNDIVDNIETLLADAKSLRDAMAEQLESGED